MAGRIEEVEFSDHVIGNEVIVAFGARPDGTPSPYSQLITTAAINRAPVPVRIIDAARYDVGDDDAGVLLTFVSASPAILFIPNGLPIGQTILVTQAGGGVVSLAADSGVTIVSRQNYTRTAGQYATLSLLSVAADQWVLSGDGA